MKKQTKQSASVNLRSKLRFLDGVLRKSDARARHIDTHIHILIGLSSATFLFSASNLLDAAGPSEAAWTALTFFSALAALMGLFGIHPPKSMRREGKPASIMYNRRIARYRSSLDYAEDLKEAVQNEDQIVKEYAAELYNVSKHYYRLKRNIFNSARAIYVTGVLISLVFLYLS